jgi:conjugal transfer mating pair stabilization protein TraN
MVKTVTSILIALIFFFETLVFDFLYLSHLPLPKQLLKMQITYAGTTTPVCLQADGGYPVSFNGTIGFCTTAPLDAYGKCPSPYIYSTENKVCISNPICPGAYIWNAQTKQCESVNVSGGSESPGYTMPDNSCAVDLNGNGDIEENEIFACTQTPQGYICSQGLTPCDPLYQQPSCPAGYTYNSQTQKCEATVTQGVCSSQQVPITQYQCPTTGQIYSDLNQCNGACLQTAQCSQSQGYGSCAYWVNRTRCDIVSSVCYFSQTPVYQCAPNSTCYFQYYNKSSLYYSLVFDKDCNFNIYNARGYFEGRVAPGGALGIIESEDCYYIDPGSPDLTCSQLIDTFYNVSSPTTTYTCPFGSQYSCSGNPPTCTRGQACVTNSSTVTKWQCSLNGVQYDTQQQCTTSCYSSCPTGGSFNPSTGKCEATATCSTGTLESQGCFTGYGCPLGNYQCMQVNNQWMCSPYQCITQNQLIDEGDVIPAGYEDDGPRDEQGNCLGTIYIFNGKGMRCRKSGVDTGFHNCCNESRGKLYDSTGSIGGGVGNLGKVAETIAGVYQAINVGTFTVKSLSANYAIITFNNGVVDKVVHPVAGTLTGTQARAWVEGMMKQGALTYGNPVSGGMTVRIDISISADKLTASTMSEYLKQSGLANSVVGLATSMIIKDPVLSSAVNVAAQSILVALGYGSALNIATAVVGLAMALFMKKCDQQDIMTSTFNDSGYCHEVGEYCIKKWKFVGCVQKAKGFCCFNSKLARIIHEQGRPQLKGFQPNGAWGDPKSPNCRGFLPEEFQALDFNKIDLSEYIEDIQRNIRQNLEPQLKQQVQQNWGR